MKVGVISDTHLVSGGLGFRKLAAQVVSKSREGFDYLQNIVEKNFGDVERILHAGDLVDMEVIDLLEEFAPVDAVSGNMDPSDVRNNLPIKKIIEIEGRRIGLIHGYGSPTGIVGRISGEFDDAHAIVFGHSHSPMNDMIGDTLFFNPGSPTDRRFAKHRSIGILNVTPDSIRGEIIKLGD